MTLLQIACLLVALVALTCLFIAMLRRPHVLTQRPPWWIKLHCWVSGGHVWSAWEHFDYGYGERFDRRQCQCCGLREERDA